MAGLGGLLHIEELVVTQGTVSQAVGFVSMRPELLLGTLWHSSSVQEQDLRRLRD